MGFSFSSLSGAAFTHVEAFYQVSSAPRTRFSFASAPRPLHGLCRITAGRFVYTEDEQKLTAAAGDVVYLKKGSRYTVVSQEDGHGLSDVLVGFDLAHEAEFAPWLTVLSRGGNPGAADAFERLCALCSRDAALWEKTAELYRLFTFLAESGDLDPCARQARELLSDPACPLTEAELANACHVSVSTLQRSFRAAYRESIGEYRARLRLAKAREDLLSGRYSVGEVARRLGFCDAAYFTRFFTRQTGQSPTAFLRGTLRK